MEFKPLFNAGIHDISKDVLTTHFLDPFVNQDKRKQLIERFILLLEKVESIGIKFEVWIDGSFVTEKIEPNDIDVAFFFDPIQMNALSEEKKLILLEISNNALSKVRYNCDVYFLSNDSVEYRSYWRGWFGFTREEVAKGFARLMIN